MYLTYCVKCFFRRICLCCPPTANVQFTDQAILDVEALWAEAPDGSGRDDMHHEKVPEHMEMFYGDGQEQGGISVDDSTNSNHSYAESSAHRDIYHHHD